MALAEDLEQQLRAGLGERHVAQFVDDQQLSKGKVLLQSQQAALVARFLELMDEAGSGSKGNREPPLTGSKTQGQGNMGLPRAARSSAILPGVRQQRFGSFIRSIRAAAKSLPSSARNGTPARCTSPSDNLIARWPCCRHG